ncbi:TetR family transcriptional regulator [Salipiger aestuarii]|nr:TetR family transcriptional regulator [Salipiger aestuarii]KAA8616142.1 TetR family transcriptional regulator [Salipiger aestuarii]KAB2543410.1 TetR family transcriptional regulator [Salipiger aestuarii]
MQIDAQTREAMVLDAVADLLGHSRLEDVSMAGIARKVGMSKRTLYAIFGSREELLGATFARIGRTIFRPLESRDHARPLCERLRKLLTINPMPQFEQAPLELLRAVVAEAPMYPGIAQQFDAEGRGALIGYITHEIESAADAGEIVLHGMTPFDAAELLADMVMGNALHHLLTPSETKSCDPYEEKCRRRDHAVDIFLHGLQPR